MKKTIITIISTALITSSIFALGMEINPEKEVAAESPVKTTESISETQMKLYNYYPLLMETTFIDTETNMTEMICQYGHVWEFETEDECVGDLYTFIMCDNGTEEVEDDYPAGTITDYATESMIDMETVVDYEVTETGIMFNFADGTGYYFEK